jgi:hypothetical protein
MTKAAADYRDRLDRSNPAMPLPPDFADFSISGATAIKQFAVPVNRKGASFANPNRSS